MVDESSKPPKGISILLFMLWGFLGAPVFAFAFTCAAMAGWWVVNFSAPGEEQRMAVCGAYYWFLMNPLVGYMFAWLLAWRFHRLTVVESSPVKKTVKQLLLTVLGGYLCWMVFLYVCNLLR